MEAITKGTSKMGNILKLFLREAYKMSKHSAAQKQDLPHLWLDKLRYNHDLLLEQEHLVQHHLGPQHQKPEYKHLLAVQSSGVDILAGQGSC